MFHATADVLDRAMPTLVDVAIWALPCLVLVLALHRWGVPMGRKSPRRFPIWIACLFLAPWGAISLASGVIPIIAGWEVQTFLGNDDVTRITINGQVVADPEATLAVLRSIGNYWSHHSHPAHRISIVVESPRGDLTLLLGRDSSNQREYWVFVPRYRTTAMNEIGRIFTSAFDKY